MLCGETVDSERHNFPDGLHHVTIIASRILGVAVDDDIVAPTNADTKEGPIQDILKAAAIALSSRNSSPSPSSSPPTVTIACRSDPPLLRHHTGVTLRKDDNVGLTGTYYNAGYGTGVLCNMQSASPSCKCVVEDAFRSIDPSLSPNSSSNDLLTIRLLGPAIYHPHPGSFTQTTALLDFCWVDLRARAKTLGENKHGHFRHWFPLRWRN